MANLIRAEDNVEVPDRLPVVALRDLVFFPYIVLPILIGRHRSVAALDVARADDGLVLLVAQKDPSVDDPSGTDLFRVGTIARIVQVTKLPDGTSRVVLEGLGRGRIRRLTTTTVALRASIELLVAREAEPKRSVRVESEPMAELQSGPKGEAGAAPESEVNADPEGRAAAESESESESRV